MDSSAGELLPPRRPPEHPAGQVVVGAVSRAGSWFDAARGGDTSQIQTAVDVAIGAGHAGAIVVRGAATFGWRLSSPLRAVVSRPPLVPLRYQPATMLEALARHGRQFRLSSEQSADAVVSTLVIEIVEAVIARIDLTSLVLERVDLDRVVAAVDIDTAVRRLDLTSLVVDNVALDTVVDAVDIDAVVAGVDIDAIIGRVDVDAIADRIAIDRIIERIDLASLARYVIDEIDLPEIIRQSTGSVASEAVRGVRMQSVEADQAVQRTIDRMLLRRRGRSTQAPTPSDPTGVEP